MGDIQRLSSCLKRQVQKNNDTFKRDTTPPEKALVDPFMCEIHTIFQHIQLFHY
jgi:hypothetical protein